MPSPVTSILNIGPSSAELYKRAGINTAEQIIEMGADAAYAQLLKAGVRPHFIGYYSLVLGLEGRPWADCSTAEKKLLRDRFDAIKADAKPAGGAGLESELRKLSLL